MDIAVAEPRLPEEVQRFGITARKQAPDLTMVVNLFSPDESRDTLFLSNYALINVVDALKRVEGVGEISLPGRSLSPDRRWVMGGLRTRNRLRSCSIEASDACASDFGMAG